MRRRRVAPLLALVLGGLLAAPLAWAAPGARTDPPTAAGLQLVWQEPSGALQSVPATPPSAVPLGSVWKLFVYSYLVATDSPSPAYRCEAARREPGDEYCCEPGESIERDAALQRSCGSFFSPQRLGLTEPAWRRFWAQQAKTAAATGAIPTGATTTGANTSDPNTSDPTTSGRTPSGAPPSGATPSGPTPSAELRGAGGSDPAAAAPGPLWLQQLAALQPATRVPPAELLAALRQVPAVARRAAREALLPNTLREPGLLAAVGSAPRFKTWSWFDSRGERWGGAAGWLGDGAPFWLGAPGTGRRVLQRAGPQLAQAWQGSGQLEPPLADSERLSSATSPQAPATPCVNVRLFARYPLAAVLTGHPAQAAPPGPLRLGQRYTLRFANGQQLQVPGQPQLLLAGGPRAPQLQARLGLEDYVARVVDREGDAREPAAARALAVAARSWLRQNTVPNGACLAVDDDSRAQRVSPRPPTAAAQAAAAFTQDLVLSGAPVRYREQGQTEGVLGWQEAVAASRAGRDFDTLLRQAYPLAVLASWQAQSDCERLPQAADWLAERAPRWQRRLRREVGFEALSSPPQVCALREGLPHADLQRARLYVREWLSREGRVTLIHEYLHLAFRRHPRGLDETYIERLAQQLADT